MARSAKRTPKKPTGDLRGRVARDELEEAKSIAAEADARIRGGDKDGWSDVLQALVAATSAKTQAEEARAEDVLEEATRLQMVLYHRLRERLTAGFFARLTGS